MTNGFVHLQNASHLKYKVSSLLSKIPGSQSDDIADFLLQINTEDLKIRKEAATLLTNLLSIKNLLMKIILSQIFIISERKFLIVKLR